jgi:hypothetical protein
MKFKPLLGSDLSGHIGGVVASHNTYGPYFRQRVKPVNKKTTAQQAQRASMAITAQRWRGLNPLVQAAWIAACVQKKSRKGDVVCLSGEAAFVFVNTLRQRMALSVVNSPPASIGIPAITLPTLAFSDASTVDCTFAADSWNAADGGVIVSGGLATSPGQNYIRARNAIDTLTNPGTSLIPLALPFAVPIGGKVLLEFHATCPDGRQSAYVSAVVTNPSFAPPVPTPLHVLEVTLVGTKKYLWRFDGPITVTPGAEPALRVNNDTTGSSAQAGPNNAEVTYGTSASTPLGWEIPNQPGTIAEAIAFVQSGTTD